jgi:hypothetical protein
MHWVAYWKSAEVLLVIDKSPIEKYWKCFYYLTKIPIAKYWNAYDNEPNAEDWRCAPTAASSACCSSSSRLLHRLHARKQASSPARASCNTLPIQK